MNHKEEQKKQLELYVHIPFCVKKCDYCDFLSGPATAERQEAYVQALLEEIRHTAQGKDREVVSVFLGGGTPSILEGEQIRSIMEEIRQEFDLTADAEITIEANPGTLTGEKLRTYRSCGINRLSLGLQSVKEKELKSLGRIHTFEEFLDSFYLARKAGFQNINVDLMCAIPGQTLEGWLDNLRTVAELGAEHISAYSLIVEEGTPFWERELDLPDEDTEYRMYEETASVLEAYGFTQYEISNYGKKGCFCKHNIGYWKRRDYLGLGLGAASLYENTRFSNTTDMEQYLAASSVPEKLRREVQTLTGQEQMEEFMFLGLRMTQGISLAEFREDFGEPLPDSYAEVLKKYEKTGFMERQGDFWRFTRKGIHVSNRILAEFLE